MVRVGVTVTVQAPQMALGTRAVGVPNLNEDLDDPLDCLDVQTVQTPDVEASH